MEVFCREMKTLFVFLALLLSGCTFSVNLIHTEGVANDVVDEVQKPSFELDASFPAV